MEAYYPSHHTMSLQFPLIRPPSCPLCPNTPIRARVDTGRRSQHAHRPYYYCQADHKRQFVTRDDILGISNANPRCQCGFHSRRNEGSGPVPSAWYNCASRQCSFNQNIEADDSVESVQSSPSSWKGSTSSTVAGTSYRGHDHKTVVSTENDKDLLDQMADMTRKIEDLGTMIASRPSTTTRPFDNNCSIHGNGRRPLFSRRRCTCIHVI
ncbi:hypothetical protein QYS62_003124 [Fusarium acuminatum]|uniref:GRF-like zinc ribbon domain-containing protein n=1 Tax=Fusarium acuminatum TaxID=5515 RepID=A0ABZ2WQQ8_9HYPO